MCHFLDNHTLYRICNKKIAVWPNLAALFTDNKYFSARYMKLFSLSQTCMRCGPTSFPAYNFLTISLQLIVNFSKNPFSGFRKCKAFVMEKANTSPRRRRLVARFGPSNSRIFFQAFVKAIFIWKILFLQMSRNYWNTWKATKTE